MHIVCLEWCVCMCVYYFFEEGFRVASIVANTLWVMRGVWDQAVRNTKKKTQIRYVYLLNQVQSEAN